MWEGARLDGVDECEGGPGAGFFDRVVPCRTDPRVRLAFQVLAQKDVRWATTSSSLKAQVLVIESPVQRTEKN